MPGWQRVADLGSLPKAHLHLHLEGAMRRSTLDELADRYGIDRPPDTRHQHFPNFGGFSATYQAAVECVRSSDDLARLILEVAEDAASHGCWWVETAFDADRYTLGREGSDHQLFTTEEACWYFAFAAAELAERSTGVGIAFVSAADRTAPVERAMQRAALTNELAHSPQRMIESGMATFTGHHSALAGFGLHANEEGYPPAPFAEAFRLAVTGTDLLSMPHAGEIAPTPGGGPASVLDAVELLGANRIAHGVLAIEDPAVVERLASHQICLDVCPSSNVYLGVVPSFEEHPLPALVATGVRCTLASDDPLLFGPNLLEEFEACRELMGMSDQTLAGLARNSFEFSAAPSEVKQAAFAAIDAWLAADRTVGAPARV